MKFFNLAFLSVFGLTLISSCQSTPEKENTEQTTPVAENWIIDSARVLVEGKPWVVGQDTAISSFSVVYPYLKTQDSTAQVMNRLVEERVKSLAWAWLGRDDAPDMNSKSLAWLGKEFVNMAEQDFAGSGIEAPISSLSYDFQLKGQVVYQSPVFMTIQFDSYAYTGGAHPNSSTDMLHISLQNGQELRPEKWIQDTTALKTIAQRYFLANEKKVDATATPDQYFFGSEFTLPNAMAVSPQGLRLIYSPYEAASYARGFIEFTIPFKDLEGILRKDVLGLK